MAEIPQIITPADLAPFADIDEDKAQAMIDDALALAVRVAPCITDADLDPADAAAIKAILRGAILRWNDSGTGALSGWQQAAGSFQVSQTLDSRMPHRSLLWPSEITALQGICKTGTGDGAFGVDTVPGTSGIRHADICSINFGSEFCSCGAILTQRGPLYERWS